MSETWPDGCLHRNSCARHRQCMYFGCAHRDRDIGAEVDAVLATHHFAEGDEAQCAHNDVYPGDLVPGLAPKKKEEAMKVIKVCEYDVVVSLVAAVGPCDDSVGRFTVYFVGGGELTIRSRSAGYIALSDADAGRRRLVAAVKEISDAKAA